MYVPLYFKETVDVLFLLWQYIAMLNVEGHIDCLHNLFMFSSPWDIPYITIIRLLHYTARILFLQ